MSDSKFKNWCIVELFGHTKGAFTGANQERVGKFEEADGGTIFLDEIGDISSYMQQSLLRVLQEKEIHPIGGNAKKIEVRVISATNKNLIEACEANEFRKPSTNYGIKNELRIFRR